MRYPSVLKPYFRDIEAAGGYGTCHINFVRGQQDPRSGKEVIAGFRFSVEILVPFQYGGEHLLAVGKGVTENRTQFCVTDLDDLEYQLQRGRMATLTEAVHSLRNDIKEQMLKVRPTTSLKKQRRKVGTILRRCNLNGLAQP